MELHEIDPARARDLIRELDAYQNSLYPPESNHLESEEKLKNSNVKLFGCEINERMAAIGAAKLMEDYGEIKRVYVTPGQRGKGLAKAIMERLELEILNHGQTIARLETGIHQKEAIGLYERIGYIKRGPFGDYKPDPLSVFMEKKLARQVKSQVKSRT